MSNKMKGMGGHMTAALLFEVRWIDQTLGAQARHHEMIAADLEQMLTGKAYRRMRLNLAAQTGGLLGLLAQSLKEISGGKPKSEEISKHRAIARSLQTKATDKINKLKAQLADRGYYGPLM